jgi:hypothetical protein
LIQSAMMFALGFFVSGLLWLAFSVALVRRARRLTERRLLAQVATRRAEFDSERDELRARHAVQMHRLEREVSRVLDQATAHRLEADLKERDLNNARAELAAREDDLADYEQRLADERDVIQDLERRHAEAGAALRATQHALRLEGKRRAIAEESIDATSVLADQRRMALSALRMENDGLRARLGEPPSAPLPIELEDERPRRVATIAEEELEPELEPIPLPTGGNLVQLPTRPRPAAAADLPERLTTALTASADGQLAGTVWRAPANPEPHLPVATAPGDGNVAELVALRIAPPSATPETGNGEDKAEPPQDDAAETRFFEALAEIRALKRAANQAGE